MTYLVFQLHIALLIGRTPPAWFLVPRLSPAVVSWLEPAVEAGHIKKAQLSIVIKDHKNLYCACLLNEKIRLSLKNLL